MVLHVVSQLERLPAEFTFKGSVAGVNRQMGYQRTHIGKRLSAKLAQHYTTRSVRRQIVLHGRRGLISWVRRLVGHRGSSSAKMGLHQVQRFGQRQSGVMLQLFSILQGLQTVREDVTG